MLGEEECNTVNDEKMVVWCKAVVLATAATVLAVPLFSQPASGIIQFLEIPDLPTSSHQPL